MRTWKFAECDCPRAGAHILSILFSSKNPIRSQILYDTIETIYLCHSPIILSGVQEESTEKAAATKKRCNRATRRLAGGAPGSHAAERGTAVPSAAAADKAQNEAAAPAVLSMTPGTDGIAGAGDDANGSLLSQEPAAIVQQDKGWMLCLLTKARARCCLLPGCICESVFLPSLQI